MYGISLEDGAYSGRRCLFQKTVHIFPLLSYSGLTAAGHLNPISVKAHKKIALYFEMKIETKIPKFKVKFKVNEKLYCTYYMCIIINAKDRGKSVKLDVKAFALASGIVSGISSLVIALLIIFTGRRLRHLEIFVPFLPRHKPTILGAEISAIWMLIYGLKTGALLAYIYNYFAKE